MTIQRLVVAADAHLNRQSGADLEALIAWLDLAESQGDAVLLAGDVYDFWFSYRRLIPRDCIRATARIIELARHVPVFLLGGNHDRWGNAFWTPEAGVPFGRRFDLTVGARKIVALHGDGLHRERSKAGVLNRVLDLPSVHRFFDFLPPAAGFGIAHRLAHDPGFAASHPEVIAAAVARQATWAREELARHHEIDVLVLAHTHRAVLEEITPGRWYLNPGAWLGEHRYAVITDSSIELRRFG